MPATAISRPADGEFAPFYGRYIALVPGSEILAVLKQQAEETINMLDSRKESDGNLRYAPDKWTVKEILGHLVDGERVFGYRALRVARADQTPMEGFEQDDWVRHGSFAQRSLAGLIEEFRTVRASTLSLLENLPQEAWTRTGTANNNKVSVRALAYIIAGHELHHRRILQEKYFSQKPAE
jgi:uncharacterized damage-inducible protein DinB